MADSRCSSSRFTHIELMRKWPNEVFDADRLVMLLEGLEHRQHQFLISLKRHLASRVGVTDNDVAPPYDKAKT